MLKTAVSALLPVLALLVAGCAPRIDVLEAGPGNEGAAVPVHAGITPFTVNVLTPTLEVEDLLAGGGLQPAGTLAASGGTSYDGVLTGLVYGPHRVKMTVPYRIPLSTSTRTVSRETSLLVGAPPGCFSFDAGVGAEGWRMVGIFDGGNPNTQVSTCSPLDNPAFVSGAANWPNPASGFAGVATPLGPGCFPTSAAGLSSGLWAFDFRSPSVETRPGWANATRYSFRVDSSDGLLFPDALHVQALLKVRKPDGTESFFRELEPDGSPRFVTVTPGWQVLTFNFSPPAGSTTLGSVIRFFGAPAPRSSDIAARIDGVCPG